MGEAGDELKELYGDRTLLRTLNGIVSGKHPLSQDCAALADPEAREGYVRKIIGRYRRSAKDVLIAEFPEVLR